MIAHHTPRDGDWLRAAARESKSLMFVGLLNLVVSTLLDWTRVTHTYAYLAVTGAMLWLMLETMRFYRDTTPTTGRHG